MTTGAGSHVLEEITAARSLPLNWLRSLIGSKSVALVGTYAPELAAALGRPAYISLELDPARRFIEGHYDPASPRRPFTTVWDHDVIVLLDLVAARLLLQDADRLAMAAFATRRHFVFPLEVEADAIILVTYASQFTAPTTKDGQTWRWCVGVTSKTEIEIYSFHAVPIAATFSFGFILPNQEKRNVSVGDVAVDPYLAQEHKLVLQPGRNIIPICSTPLTAGSSIDGRLFHFAIKDARVICADDAPKLAGSRTDSTSLNDVVIRARLHAAGFNFVTAAVLPGIGQNETRTPWSRGNKFEPQPLELAGQTQHRGIKAFKEEILWYATAHRLADLGPTNDD
jgi:hypothetical protein